MHTEVIKLLEIYYILLKVENHSLICPLIACAYISKRGMAEVISRYG